HVQRAGPSHLPAVRAATPRLGGSWCAGWGGILSLRSGGGIRTVRVLTYPQCGRVRVGVAVCGTVLGAGVAVRPAGSPSWVGDCRLPHHLRVLGRGCLGAHLRHPRAQPETLRLACATTDYLRG